MPGRHNGAGTEMSGPSEPFPEGPYNLRIVSAEAGQIITGNNAGCDKVTVNLRVVDGEYQGRAVNYHNVSFLPAGAKGAGMALNFLKAIGEPYSQEGEFEWDERRWVGRVVRAFVAIEPDNQGRKWNKIKYVMDPSPEYQEANERMAKAGQTGESIPF